MENLSYGDIFNIICKNYNITMKSNIINNENIIIFSTQEIELYFFKFKINKKLNLNDIYDNIIVFLLNSLNFKI